MVIEIQTDDYLLESEGKVPLEQILTTDVDTNNTEPTYHNFKRAHYIQKRFKMWEGNVYNPHDPLDFEERRGEYFEWSQKVLANSSGTALDKISDAASNIGGQLAASLSVATSDWEGFVTETAPLGAGAAIGFLAPVASGIGSALLVGIGTGLVGGAVTGGIMAYNQYENLEKNLGNIGLEAPPKGELLKQESITGAIGGAITGAASAGASILGRAIYNKTWTNTGKRASTGIVTHENYLDAVKTPSAPVQKTYTPNIDLKPSAAMSMNYRPITTQEEPTTAVEPLEVPPQGPQVQEIQTPDPITDFTQLERVIEDNDLARKILTMARLDSDKLSKLIDKSDLKNLQHFLDNGLDIDPVLLDGLKNKINKLYDQTASGMELVTHPEVILEQSNDRLSRIVSDLKGLELPLATDLNGLNSFREKMHTYMQTIGSITDYHVTGEGFLDPNDTFYKHLEQFYNWADQTYKTARQTQTIDVEEKNSFTVPGLDTIHLLPFYSIEKNALTGLMEYNQDKFKYTVTGDDELGDLYNIGVRNLLDGMPFNDRIAYLYDKLSTQGTLQNSFNSIYINNLARGLDENEIKWLYDNTDNKQANLDFLLILSGDKLASDYDVINKIASNYIDYVAPQIEADFRKLGVTLNSSLGQIYIPQSHDTDVLNKTNIEVWVRETMPLLDWIRMARQHLPQGQSYTEEGKKLFLEAAYRNITETSAGRFPKGKGLSRVENERVLHFKDAHSWNQYNLKYGRGEPALIVIGQHLRSTAKNMSFLQTFGLKPLEMRKILTEALRTKEGQEIPSLIENKIGMIKNGLYYLFDYVGSGIHPNFFNKSIDSAQELAATLALKNVDRYGLASEPFQAAMVGKKFGMEESIFSAWAADIKSVIGDITSLVGLGNNTKDAIRKVLGKDSLEQLEDMALVQSAERMIDFNNPNSRKDTWPVMSKLGRKIHKLMLSGENYLFEHARFRSRMLFERLLYRNEWAELTDSFKNLWGNIGLNEKDFIRFKKEILPYGTSTTVANGLEVNTYHPLKAINHFRNEGDTVKMALAQKTEQAVIAYIQQARTQGDQMINAMQMKPRKAQGAAVTKIEKIAEMIAESYNLFTGWSRTMRHFNRFLNTGDDSILGYRQTISYITYMTLPSLLTCFLTDTLSGFNPFANVYTLTASVIRAVVMAGGYNWIAASSLQFLSGGASVYGLIGALGLSRLGTPAFLALLLAFIGAGAAALYYGYQGDTVKSMHYARKMNIFRGSYKFNVITERMIMDNIFDFLAPAEAREEYFKEIEDQQRGFREYWLQPGQLTASGRPGG